MFNELKKEVAKAIINYLYDYLQASPEEVAAKKANLRENVRRANIGRKLMMLLAACFAIEILAFWAMTSSELMRARYGYIFQRFRADAAAWADFVPKMMMLSVILLIAAVSLHAIFMMQKSLECEEDRVLIKLLEKVIKVLALVSLWLTLFTLWMSLLVSIADANLANTLSLVNLVLHPSRAFMMLAFTSVLLAAIVYFVYTAVYQVKWIIKEMPATIAAVKSKLASNKEK